MIKTRSIRENEPYAMISDIKRALTRMTYAKLPFAFRKLSFSNEVRNFSNLITLYWIHNVEINFNIKRYLILKINFKKCLMINIQSYLIFNY